MPFYIRIPLPGPFGFSARVGGRKRKRRRPAQAARRPKPVSKREAAAVHAKAEEIRARQAAERLEREARTTRAVVTAVSIDPLRGGTFTLTDANANTLTVQVPAGAAQRFLSLKKGDVADAIMTPDRSKIEYLEHVSRANGAVPRSPASGPIG
jgi:hypothetical protein